MCMHGNVPTTITITLCLWRDVWCFFEWLLVLILLSSRLLSRAACAPTSPHPHLSCASSGVGAHLWILIRRSSSSTHWTYQRWISSHIRCLPHRWTTVRAGQIVTAERVDAHLLAHAPKATSAGPTNARAALHLREDGRRPPRKMRSEKLAMWQIARNSQPLAGLVSLWRTFVEKD